MSSSIAVSDGYIGCAGIHRALTFKISFLPHLSSGVHDSVSTFDALLTLNPTLLAVEALIAEIMLCSRLR